MTTVLIDGDVLAYKVAASAEVATEFPDDMWVLWADAAEARRRFDTALEAILRKTGCGDFVLAISSANNFRLSVSDTYKSNRADTRKPMVLGHLKEYALDHHGAERWNRLEGDDVIGILATGAHRDDHLIYSIDKDLRTIPGLHWHHDLEQAYEVDEDDAYTFFLAQVLAGDATDGYPGCPGVGMKTALERLELGQGPVPHEHTFKSGPRKDTTETRWSLIEGLEPWQVVLAHYEKAGLTEEDAIVQARQARILHNSDYEDGRIILWEPN